MGRGRAKAKQTKVARELKYSTPTTDLDALQRELAGSSGSSKPEVDDTDDEYDDYASYDSDTDDDDWAPGRR